MCINRSTLKEYSPTHFPILWIAINAGCCVAAALVFLDAASGDDIRVVSASYLVYNMVVCTVWSAETFLYFQFHSFESKWDFIATGLELAVAAFYAIDCTIEFIQWHQAKKSDVYFDSILDFVFYVYYLVRAVRQHYLSARGSNDMDESLMPSSATTQNYESVQLPANNGSLV